MKQSSWTADPGPERLQPSDIFITMEPCFKKAGVFGGRLQERPVFLSLRRSTDVVKALLQKSSRVWTRTSGAFLGGLLSRLI